nr:MAG TPA: YopX protein [Caudoviricetes sp.]
MREIKFRAWDKKFKKWTSYSIDDGLVMFYDDHEECWEIGQGGERFILCQYIGLKDKNGRGICEGDIVNYRSWGNEYNLEVVWIEEKARFGLKTKAGHINMKLWKYDWYEIIGNIYENPELLEEVVNVPINRQQRKAQGN